MSAAELRRALRVGWFGLALTAPALAGGVSADYARQVDAVQMRLAQLEGLALEAEGSIRRLEEAQRALAVPSAGSGGAADGEEVRAVRGQLEVLQFELRSVREAMEALATDLDTRALWQEARLAQLEAALALSPPPVPTGDSVPLPPRPTEPDPGAAEPTVDGEPPTVVLVGADADGMMTLAEEHMRAGRQRAARAVLDRVLAEHGDSPRVAEALYRRAETFFNDREWGTAANEFQKVVDRYPRDALAAWAMLRQGECFSEMGQPDSATLFWETLVQEYPRSDAAREARAHLR